jgi:hypothetical protein
MEGKIMFSALFRRTIRAEVEAAFKLYKAVMHQWIPESSS